MTQRGACVCIMPAGRTRARVEPLDVSHEDCRFASCNIYGCLAPLHSRPTMPSLCRPDAPWVRFRLHGHARAARSRADVALPRLWSRCVNRLSNAGRMEIALATAGIQHTQASLPSRSRSARVRDFVTPVMGSAVSHIVNERFDGEVHRIWMSDRGHVPGPRYFPVKCLGPCRAEDIDH
jgi:hypothetical protein